MTRVFITGGLGFIGQSILSQTTFEKVTIYDLSLDSFRKDEPEFKGVEFVKGDILDVDTLTRAMEGHDVVIHLAAYMNSKPTIDAYIAGANVNINGTLNVVEAMKRNKIKKLIFFSSSFVYGNSSDNDKGNSENSCKNPHTGYGITKIACEGLIREVDYVVMRPSIVCGKYDWFGQSISVFIKQALANGEIVISSGSEDTSRDYVYSLDVGAFVNHIITKDAFDGSVYNLSSHEKVTTLELVNKIAKICGSTVKIVEGGNSKTLLKTLNLDNSKSKYPFKKIDEYLEEYIDWARHNHQTYW
jgi:nucleoside-diphosphate-sugar epimerase